MLQDLPDSLPDPTIGLCYVGVGQGMMVVLSNTWQTCSDVLVVMNLFMNGFQGVDIIATLLLLIRLNCHS